MDQEKRAKGNKTLMIMLVVVAFILAIGLTKDMWIKAAVVSAVKQAAGVNVEIDHLSLSVIRQRVRIKGVRVYNPEGFPAQEVMVDIPEVVVTLDVPALFKNILHAPLVRLDLKEARIIRNKIGALNVNSLKFSQQKPASVASAPESSTPKQENQAAPRNIKMQLDVVSLNIDTIYLEDYSSGKDKPKLTVMKVNIKNIEFKNITSPDQLGSAVMFQALMPAGLDQAFSASADLIDQRSGVKGLGNLIGGLFKGLGKNSGK